eukprot:PhM_4_TR11643/c0_g1_i1/m.68214
MSVVYEELAQQVTESKAAIIACTCAAFFLWFVLVRQLRGGCPSQLVREILLRPPFPLNLRLAEYESHIQNHMNSMLVLIEFGCVITMAPPPERIAPTLQFLFTSWPSRLLEHRDILFPVLSTLVLVWAISWIPLLCPRRFFMLVGKHNLERHLPLFMRWHTTMTYVFTIWFTPIVTVLLDKVLSTNRLVSPCWIILETFVILVPFSGHNARFSFAHPPFQAESDVRVKRTFMYIKQAILATNVMGARMFVGNPVKSLACQTISISGLAFMHYISAPCAYDNINQIRGGAYFMISHYLWSCLLFALAPVRPLGLEGSKDRVDYATCLAFSVWLVGGIAAIIYAGQHHSFTAKGIPIIAPSELVEQNNSFNDTIEVAMQKIDTVRAKRINQSTLGDCNNMRRTCVDHKRLLQKLKVDIHRILLEYRNFKFDILEVFYFGLTERKSGLMLPQLACNGNTNNNNNEYDSMVDDENDHADGQEMQLSPDNLTIKCRGRSRPSLDCLLAEMDKPLDSTSSTRASSVSTSHTSPPLAPSPAPPLSSSECNSPWATPRSRGMSHRALFTQEQLDKVYLERVVGRGATGRVYHGIIEQSDGSPKSVAVKVMDTSRANSTSLCRELTYLKTLDHPNIVRYFGTSRTDDGMLMVFLEYAFGDLQSRLRARDVKLNTKQLTRDILRGLQYLHTNNVLHRDIKAANVLLDWQGNARLSDFGCSRPTGELSSTMTHIGTPWFIAPEIVTSHVYSTKSDIWAVGCTLIQILNGGQSPWREIEGVTNGVLSFLNFVSKTDSVPNNLPEEGISSGCSDFLAKCLNRDPEKRWTASELLEHPWLQNTFEEEPIPSIHKLSALECATPLRATSSSNSNNPLYRFNNDNNNHNNNPNKSETSSQPGGLTNMSNHHENNTTNASDHTNQNYHQNNSVKERKKMANPNQYQRRNFDTFDTFDQAETVTMDMNSPEGTKDVSSLKK